MPIELHKTSYSMMYTPFINGRLHEELFYFLEYRYKKPEKISLQLKAITKGSGTLRIIAYRIKFFLDFLEDNSIQLEDVTYEDVELFLDTMQKVNDWKDDYYNQTYTYLRQFLEFLPKIGFVTSANFPAQRVEKHAIDLDGDFFSHTKDGNSKTHIVDPGHKRIVEIGSYKGKVLSMQQFHSLYDSLKEIDPVYSIMALVKMQTCMRIENLCQIPLNFSELNPNWMQYPEFSRSGLDTLEFHFIGKGRKCHQIHFFPSTIEIIYKDYIEKYFDKRIELFKEKYLKRKNATFKEGLCIIPTDILWLDQNGNPVKPSMLQGAFRKASKIIGFRVCPHKMRHTGATHLLWNFCQIHGVEPDEKMAGDFTDFLQYVLGHVNIETTKLYIKTIKRQKAMLTVPFCLPATGDKVLERLPLGIRETSKIIEFYEGSKTGKIIP